MQLGTFHGMPHPVLRGQEDSCGEHCGYPLGLRPIRSSPPGASVAVTAVAELLDESWVGWRPIELGPGLGRGGALIEQ
jgi:hypothetical protein